MQTLTRLVEKHHKNIADCVKDNAEKFWNYDQSKSKATRLIPNLYKTESKDDTTEADIEKADVLSYFLLKILQCEKMPDEFSNDLHYKTIICQHLLK